MTWREQLRPPSYKGVPFFVEDDQLAGGRRGELHEYPQRDTPYFEDLGRKARDLQLRVYQLGADYMTERDRLLKAIEDGGAGTLVHPWLGEMQVVCVSWSKRESKDEGGKVYWNLAFVEAGENVHPVARPQTRRATRRFADAALPALRTAFASAYRLRAASGNQALVGSGLGGFLGDEAGGMIADFAATVAAARGLRDVGRDVAATVASGALEALLVDLSDNPVGAAAMPDLADRLIEAVQLFASPPAAALVGSGTGDDAWVADRATLRGLAQIAAFAADLPPPPLTTQSRRQQWLNQQALSRLVDRVAVVEMARLSASIAPDSYQDAVALRDRVANELDRVADIAGDAGEDEARRVLLDLRARVIEDLKERGASLAPLIEYATQRPRASLALAWQLYQDVGREADLVRRNRAFHPGFMPARGEALAS